MHKIDTFLNTHRETLLKQAPDTARENRPGDAIWAMIMPFCKLADGRALSLIVELTQEIVGEPLVDYRLLVESPHGGALDGSELLVGEFAKTRKDLMNQLERLKLDRSLADEPAAHRMYYYVEQLYWNLAGEVAFNTHYDQMMAG